jgi:transketolase
MKTKEKSVISTTQTAYLIRKIIIEQSKRAKVGHIGSALSIADIIAALYGEVLNIPDIDAADRDLFLLSKGHAALAVYAALHLRGWITEKELNTFCSDNSLLGVHPEHVVKGVDYTSGSLGFGLSVGAGAALAARLKDSSRRVFVLLSDAECNEGSVWEAIMFAAHQGLSNLIAIIDLNGQQAFDYTKNVLNLSPMIDRWKAFGWDVHDVDGHDIAGMAKTIAGLKTESGAPHVLIAHTVFGKGVSFMENQIKWHYFPLSDGEYTTAMGEIGRNS